MGRAETIVKLIGFTPVNALLASVKNMLPDATENDIAKICELKVGNIDHKLNLINRVSLKLMQRLTLTNLLLQLHLRRPINLLKR